MERKLVLNVYLIAALMAVERESMALDVVVLIAFKNRYFKNWRQKVDFIKSNSLDIGSCSFGSVKAILPKLRNLNSIQFLIDFVNFVVFEMTSFFEFCHLGFQDLLMFRCLLPTSILLWMTFSGYKNSRLTQIRLEKWTDGLFISKPLNNLVLSHHQLS